MAVARQLAAGHGDERAVRAVDDLQIANDEGIVERDRAERLQPVIGVLHQLDANLGDLHGCSLPGWLARMFRPPECRVPIVAWSQSLPDHHDSAWRVTQLSRRWRRSSPPGPSRFAAPQPGRDSPGVPGMPAHSEVARSAAAHLMSQHALPREFLPQAGNPRSQCFSAASSNRLLSIRAAAATLPPASDACKGWQLRGEAGRLAGL